ncbi:fumarylacetoacetate hydrolase family protein [Phaeacidiphilus oryzae]|uniref:fumarylacetoacetate hydrolase family protein n=1 Tax=Phaeacidiphilus oryzae TaxID=348818 RepID=UPI000A0300EC|nr:fumarylacetoacetate hydrolase family protein [Phaeacidiphilus oryzae]
MTSAPGSPDTLFRTADGWFAVTASGGTAVLPGSLGDLLALPRGEFHARVDSAPAVDGAPAGGPLLAPVDPETEIWAAGVTYETSRSARMEESGEPDIYDKVYSAERPELFFKSTGRRASGPGGPVGIRADSAWNVPEPELALVLNAFGEIVGYTACNDMSSRSIEGENPLYLPQAKVYRHSCAVGPWIRLARAVPAPRSLGIACEIHRPGAAEPVWRGSAHTGSLHRELTELAEHLFRADDHPRGVLLATGTSAVPDSSFTLRAGDTVAIEIDSIGRLSNPVVTV